MEPFDVRLYAPIATACAATISTYLWFINRSKNLSYEIMRNESLIHVKGSAKRRIKVMFDQHEVHKVELLLLRIINNGHQAVTPTDYQVPVSIRLNSDAHILAADVVETNPGDLDERFRTTQGSTKLLELQDDSKLIVKSVLLNPGDYITIQLIVEDYSAIASISGHITGVKEVGELKKNEIGPILLTLLGTLVMAGAMICLKPGAIIHFRYAEVIPYFLLFMLGSVFLWAGITIPKREKIFSSSFDMT